MADLQRLESKQPGNARIGGFIIRFPSGRAEVIEWDHGAPFASDAALTAAAKQLATQLVERLSRTASHDDMERTNWASVVAAIQRLLSDWNAALKLQLYAAGPQLVH
jgi:hypothetical protein